MLQERMKDRKVGHFLDHNLGDTLRTRHDATNQVRSQRQKIIRDNGLNKTKEEKEVFGRRMELEEFDDQFKTFDSNLKKVERAKADYMADEGKRMNSELARSAFVRKKELAE